MRKIFKILFIAALSAAVYGSPGVAYSGGVGVRKSKEAQKKEIWTCPMHPQIKKDGPGKCPICGMDLVRAAGMNNASQASQGQFPEGHAGFELPDGKIQMIGVKYGVVEKRPIFKSIETVGRVAFDPELFTARNEYLEAVKQLDEVKDAPMAEIRDSARRMVESAKLRLSVLGLSDDQIASLAKNGGPASGSNFLISTVGENAWIYADVFEMDLPHVKPGLEATITGKSFEGKTLLGKVASVDRVIDSTTRTAKARVLVPNVKIELKSHGYVDVAILSPLGEQIVIPFDAVLDSGKETWVFVVKGKGRFEPRKVTIKYHAGDEVAIGAGVDVGEKIVTSANFLIDSESRLKSVLNTHAGGHDHVQKSDDSPQKTPTCPKGQEWHEQMKHCMPKVGN